MSYFTYHKCFNTFQQSTPFGSQKMFFDHVWRRLHPELFQGQAKSSYCEFNTNKRPIQTSFDGKTTGKSNAGSIISRKKKSSKRLKIASSDDDRMSLNYASVPPLPSLPTVDVDGINDNAVLDIHQQYRSSRLPPREQCLIPKKRYMYNHGISSSYPHPSFHQEDHESSGPSATYSDSDVSVAMILATGMGRGGEDDDDKPASSSPSSKST